MSKRCEICGGEKFIKLARRPNLSVADYQPGTVEHAEAVKQIAPPYKKYPCPECSPMVAGEKVHVLECGVMADMRAEHIEGYRQSVVDEACHRMANEFAKQGFIRMEEEPRDREGLRVPYRFTLGVVAPQVVRNLQQETQKAQDEFAHALIEEIKKEIDNWGSYYGQQVITKEMTRQLIADALRKVQAARKRKPAFT